MIGETVYQPQQDIEELMNLYDQEILPCPQIPDRKTLLLRARLLFEEARETIEAAGCKINGLDNVAGDFVVIDPDLEPNLKEMGDGIGDTLVVLYGFANAIGMQVKPVWDEIQRSNLSKMWAHCSVCDEVLEKREGRGDWLFHADATPEQSSKHGGDWKVVLKIHKREDGKVIKAPTYSPADIQGVLDRQIADYQIAEFIYGEIHGEKEGTLQWS